VLSFDVLDNAQLAWPQIFPWFLYHVQPRSSGIPHESSPPVSGNTRKGTEKKIKDVSKFPCVPWVDFCV
jgi:hypothetical protein